jgi:hypothetical protein
LVIGRHGWDNDVMLCRVDEEDRSNRDLSSHKSP